MENKNAERLEIVKVSKVHEDPEIMHKASTFYRWSHVNKHPSLFLRFTDGRGLFVNKKVYRELFFQAGK